MLLGSMPERPRTVCMLSYGSTSLLQHGPGAPCFLSWPFSRPFLAPGPTALPPHRHYVQGGGGGGCTAVLARGGPRGELGGGIIVLGQVGKAWHDWD